MVKYKLIFIFVLFLVACGVSEKEADKAYQNANEHMQAAKKNPNKKEDALYFYLIAIENDKYKNTENAIIIANLAVDIYKNKSNLSIDDRMRLEKNVVTGCKLLLKLSSSKDNEQKSKALAEINNIVNSDLPNYALIRSVLVKKDKDIYNKFTKLL